MLTPGDGREISAGREQQPGGAVPGRASKVGACTWPSIAGGEYRTLILQVEVYDCAAGTCSAQRRSPWPGMSWPCCPERRVPARLAAGPPTRLALLGRDPHGAGDPRKPRRKTAALAAGSLTDPDGRDAHDRLTRTNPDREGGGPHA